jgi:MSHA biogenesis protein MshO
MTRHRARFRPRPARHGFTLVEMVVTLVLFALMAATLVLFFRPAFDTWMATRTRTALAADTDHALRRMLRDVRVAVPNSLRTPDTSCFELVPTSGGGRYRMGIDTVNGNSAAVDPAAATSSFDVLGPLAKVPAVAAGRHRLGITALQFPVGYDGGRFSVVPASQQAVFYVCSGASTTLDSNGNAPGVLYRLKAYGFNAGAPTSCPAAAAAGADVLLTGVRACRFLYSANQGATQQSGFISLQIEVTRNSETASLVVGAHVANTP